VKPGDHIVIYGTGMGRRSFAPPIKDTMGLRADPPCISIEVYDGVTGTALSYWPDWRSAAQADFCPTVQSVSLGRLGLLRL